MQYITQQKMISFCPSIPAAQPKPSGEGAPRRPAAAYRRAAAALGAPNGESDAVSGFPLPCARTGSVTLGVPKPSWIVRSESNVRKEKAKKPEPPCVICEGSGRVDCYHCRGKGRTNCVHLVMLPKGEWPKWCKACGGSGLAYCNRCLGTGEFRDIMGFHFMKINTKG